MATAVLAPLPASSCAVSPIGSCANVPMNIPGSAVVQMSQMGVPASMFIPPTQCPEGHSSVQNPLPPTSWERTPMGSGSVVAPLPPTSWAGISPGPDSAMCAATPLGSCASVCTSPPIIPMGPMSAPYPAATGMGLPQQVMTPRQKVPVYIPPGAPLIPARNFPPQRQMDSAPEDGPVSVAAHSRAEVIRIFQQRPCPNTKQYAQFQPAGLRQLQERQLGSPGHANDICGWVLAAEHGDGTDDSEYMDLQLDEFRRVYQCISGWILMMWRSEDDFKEGIFVHGVPHGH